MTVVLEIVLWVVAAAVLAPMAMLAVETLAALLPARSAPTGPAGSRPPCAVLIPAHDEEAGIGRTLQVLLGQVQPADRVVVVADNCADRTAAVACSLGAVVAERTDPGRRGKGYALDFGVRFLAPDPPAVVVIVDADCVLQEGALDLLVCEAAQGRPVQAAYVLHEPAQPHHRQQISAFAFLFKNVVRPMGLSRLGAPCLLTGSGMAFPWHVLSKVSLASGNIVEDMRLAVDLSVAGHPPRFCLQARVSSELPAGASAASAQRKRWEHGHLQTLLTQAPRLLGAALRQRRLDLLGLALELSVPPLSLLFLAWGAVLTAAVSLSLAGGSPVPAAVLSGDGLLALLAILAAWAKFGRGCLPLTSLLAAPFYVLGKVPIYVAFLFRRQQTWNRTERAALASEKEQSPVLPASTSTSGEEGRHKMEQRETSAAEGPRGQCVHQAFEEQAARTPDRLAVIFEGGQLTYRELNARANQVAHFLKTLGVGPETLVGLCVERSVEMVVGLLGILKAGAAYVPLDPDFPRDRLAHYVRDSAMPVLLTQQRLLARLPGHNARAVCLDTDWESIARHGTDDPGPGSSAENLVYVIYTSGSTGTPKGVQVLHGALANFLSSMRKQPGLTADDILLAVTTLSFDIHALELWLPLTVGARVVVVSRDVARDGIRLAQALNESGATTLQATPATWRMLLETGWQGDNRLNALCGGEPLTVALAERLIPRVGSLWNMYGPTETTVWSTVHHVRSPEAPIPIGQPIDNTRIYLVDEHLRPVMAGTEGELLIGGDGLARGYLNRPELTAEKFLPDAFAGKAGARMYRTGDLARYLPDGNLECLGRIDHQVKIRGFRIELGEIETALGRHPAVKANVVVAREESGVHSLAAYVIAHLGQDCRPEELRRFLGEKLPEYMVPSHFVSLEAFPLTPNGKIDRKALPAPRQGMNSVARPTVAPRDDVERDLAAVWEEVLQVKPIGVTDSFFDLGGDSLLAAGLVAKVRQRLGHTLPLGALFAAPTVERLAAVLERQLEAASDTSIVPLHEGEGKPALFMVAGVGGHVFTFHKFARLLGSAQPVYGVKAIGVDGTLEPPSTVEEMAAHYVKEITTLRPQGPYLLSGYSIGAIIAYELALQLRALGHRIDALFVFDMLAPGYPRKLPLPVRLWMHVCTFLRLPLREKKNYLAERLDKIRVRFRHWLGQGIRNAPDIGVEGLPEEALKRVWLALSTAASRYRPSRPFDGKVVLFKTEEGFQWPATVLDDPQYGWGKWALGGVEIHAVPGDHLEMFHEKNIHMVARKLGESIAGVTG